jgi:hypothetical protein
MHLIENKLLMLLCQVEPFVFAQDKLKSKPIKVIDFNNLSQAALLSSNKNVFSFSIMLKVTTSINSGFILKYRIVFKSNSRYLSFEMTTVKYAK